MVLLTCLGPISKQAQCLNRVVNLILSSASSSKRRQHLTEFDIDHPVQQHAKVGISSKSRDSPPGYDKEASKRARKDEHMDESIDAPIGYCSANPLRLQSLERVHHGKVKIRSFVGDGQPSTSIGMAHLFGTHITRTTAGADESEQRTVFSINDESIEAAGVDVEAPPEDLLGYIKELAEAKVATVSRKKSAPTGSITQQAIETETESNSSLGCRFDRSALVAVGVLVEELVREMMTHWYQTGAPVQLDGRALRTEALSQLSGATQPKAITPEMLRSRLEVRLVLLA